jgi:hypothetical protein
MGESVLHTVGNKKIPQVTIFVTRLMVGKFVTQIGMKKSVLLTVGNRMLPLVTIFVTKVTV